MSAILFTLSLILMAAGGGTIEHGNILIGLIAALAGATLMWLSTRKECEEIDYK